MENVKHLVVTTPITNTLKFEDDGVRRNEAMKVKEEVPPQDEEDDVKMEKKEEESPSHEGEDDEKGKEKMSLYSAALKSDNVKVTELKPTFNGVTSV